LETLKITQKRISFAYFRELCRVNGVDYADWFVDYLHKIGLLFYKKDTFQDQVILDQNWAIDAAYCVFDPNKPNRSLIERMGGHFKGKDASMFWTEEDTMEHEIYLDFMHNCGVCYEPQRWDNWHQSIPFAEREFIIPALLPMISAAKSVWGDSLPNDWQLNIEYPFLHRSIIERIILRLGETYQGEPWRTGIYCETEYGKILLECTYYDKQQSTQGQLSFHLRGNQLEHLVYALRKLVSETSPQHHRYQEYLKKSSEKRQALWDFPWSRTRCSILNHPAH
jgi:hypothetical protein